MTTLDYANSEQIRSYRAAGESYAAAAGAASQALTQLRQELPELEQQAGELDEAAFAAARAAADRLSDHKAAADSVSLLTVEEADRTKAAELLDTLVQETLSSPEAEDPRLSELLGQARQELLNCASQAEEQLQSTYHSCWEEIFPAVPALAQRTAAAC